MATKPKDGLTPLERLTALEERQHALEEREEWRKKNPLSAAMLAMPGTRLDNGILTISSVSSAQAETTAAYGPDGLPVRDTRPAAIPVRPRIRHSRVRG